MKSKLVLLSIGTILLSSPLAQARWQDDFIGNPSFKLNEDLNLSNLTREVSRLERLYNSKQQLTDREVKRLNEAVKSLSLMERAISQIETEIANHVTEISTNRAEIGKLKNSNKQFSTALSSKKEEITKKNNQIEGVKKDISNLQASLKKVQAECQAAPTDQCTQKISSLKLNIKNKSTLRDQLVVQLASLIKTRDKIQSNLTKNSAVISRLEKRSSSLELANQKKVQQNIKNKKDLIPLKRDVENRHSIVQKAERESTRAKNTLIGAQKGRDQYRQDLIKRVLIVNDQGALRATEDAYDDGYELAYRLGKSYGERDGREDGLSEGASDAKRRDYDKGYAEGLVLGKADAQIEGRQNGEREGRIQGNKLAAIDQAKKDAFEAAKISDAKAKGLREGSIAGNELALKEGNLDGSDLGMKEAIKEKESQKLKKVSLPGQFAGAFTKVIPKMPLNYRGKAYNPNKDFKRKVVEKSYRDGYEFKYSDEIQRSYYKNVSSIYESVYEDVYNENYRSKFELTYQEEIARGRSTGHKKAYGDHYTGYYQKAYKDKLEHYRRSPLKDSSEYQQQYKVTFKTAYEKEYNILKDKVFAQEKNRVYQLKYPLYLEQSRVKRKNDVLDIYQKHAVLKYESHSFVDGGVNKVGQRDGIVMPNEALYINMTISNFGKAPAKNVEVKVGSNKTYTINEIPGASSVTVQGAAKDIAPNRLGSSFVSNVTVRYPLTAETKIQGLYHERGDILNSSIRGSFNVLYPLTVEDLSISGDLIVGKENQVKATVSTRAIRSYKGKIEIKLQASLDGMVRSSFNDLESISRSAALKGASILVSDKKDAYQDLYLQAKIYKDGILLGQNEQQLKVVAKEGFSMKDSGIVALVNGSDRNNDIYHLIEQLGGASRVAVLDTSLSGNKSVLEKGLSKAKVFTNNKNSLSSLDQLMLKAKDSSFVYLNDDKNFNEYSSKMRALKHSKSLGFKYGSEKKEIQTILLNNRLNRELSSSSVLLVSDSSDIVDLKTLSSLFSKTNDELIEGIRKISDESYFHTNDQIQKRIQVAMIRSIHENHNINQAYLASGSVVSRDKDIARIVQRDKNLFHNKLGKIVKKSVKVANIGLYLFAYNYYYVMKSATSSWKPTSRDFTMAITNRLYGALFIDGALEDVKDGHKKLKSHSRSLYNKVDSNQGLHAPFDFSL
ncbi:hypothetical protein HBN50_06890 [Halobacteriovorax sp. GB3]|uniref:hypothetical protein n=1 Tax=Halobacteriovorax sp. GB3 TaxID=2719615 RepID=UPI00235F325C|nr:hypothetical protein [Halobacteriovorax sp. GB3]MDD0852813.1 hypothetical protein [Halobacteriovorax sp. GB3]